MNSTKTEVTSFPRQLDIATVCIYGLTILSMGLFLFLPFVNLLHPSPWQRWMGTIHGFASLLAMVVVSYLGHLAFPLLRGSSKILVQMRTLTFWTTILSFLGIATGNLAYMRYRAGLEYGGARAWLKENSPLGQYVFMEYHEFTVLFILPLGVACTWILWHYGDSILEKSNRPILTATCLALIAMMFFAIGGMISGLAVAKIHAL
jgi:small-conductance mechanosensitive channel